jgi:hypothetical protein
MQNSRLQNIVGTQQNVLAADSRVYKFKTLLLPAVLTTLLSVHAAGVKLNCVGVCDFRMFYAGTYNANMYAVK